MTNVQRSSRFTPAHLAGLLLLAIVSASALAAQGTPQVIYYKMNEGTGTTTANDANPGQGTNPANLPTTAPTWITPGQLGAAALDFTNASGAIDTGWSPNLSASDSWTLECWVRPTSLAFGYLYGIGSSSFRCFQNSNGTLSISTLGGTAGSITTSAALTAGVWTHLAIVYDATASNVTVYFDGNIDTVQSGTSILSGSLVVGAVTATSTSNWDGAVDEFRFWSSARAQGEIQAGMNSELPLNGFVMGGSSPGGLYAGAQTDLTALSLSMSSGGSSTSIASLTITKTGTISDSDVTSVDLWLDNNKDGAVDGGDTALGSTTFSSGQATFTGSPLHTVANGASDRLLVAFDINGGLTPGVSFGAEVTSASDINIGAQTDSTMYPVAGSLSYVSGPITSFPYVQDFETNPPYFNAAFATGAQTIPTVTAATPSTPGSASTTGSSGYGIAFAAIAGSDPNNGSSGMLDMFGGTSTGATTMDLAFDMNGFSTSDYVGFEFYWNDEGVDASTTTDPMQGVFLSTDGGATWAAALYQFPPSMNTGIWNYVTMDLSSAITALSLSYTNQMVIRFQLAENSNADHLLIDDIRIEDPAAHLQVTAVAGLTGQANIGATDALVGGFDTFSINSTQALNGVTLLQTGSIANSDLSNIKLWEDTNTDGVFNTGDTQLGTTVSALSGNMAAFNGSPLRNYTTNETIRLFVTADVSSTATVPAEIIFSIDVVSDVSTNPGYVGGTFPIDLDRVVLKAPANSYPYVQDFELPEPYFNATFATGAQSNIPTVTAVGSTPGTGAATGASDYLIATGAVAGSSPNGGTGMLDMFGGTGNGATSMDLSFDMSAFSIATDTLMLEFFWNDEGLDALAATDPYQGVFLSTNGGATWDVALYQFDGGGTEGVWHQEAINLRTMLSSLSLTYTSQIVIRFQMVDSLTSDHLLIDDISVFAPPAQVLVTGGDAVAAPAARPADTDAVIGSFLFEGINSNQAVSDIVVTKLGSLSDSEISAVRLWVDTNSDNVLNSGDTQIGATTAFATGQASFNGAPLLQLNNGSELLFVSIDIVTGATVPADVGCEITAAGDVTASPGSVTGAFAVNGNMLVQIIQPASLPFATGFETPLGNTTTHLLAGTYPNATAAGAPPTLGTSTQDGVVDIATTAVAGSSAHGGSNMLNFYFSSSFGAAAMDFYIDMSTVSTTDSVRFEFWWNDEGIDTGSTTEPFNYVFLSNDGGITWALAVFDFIENGTEGVWNQEIIDLSQMMSTAGLNFTADMVIRFQCADTISSDNLLIDDILVEVMPDIDVARGGTSIPHNGIDIVGINPIGQSAQFTYNITNVAPTGANDLGLTGSPLVQITNSYNCTVSIPTQPTIATFSPGQSDSYVLDITPSAGGTFLVEVLIPNNDPDEPQYKITIVGTGAEPEIDVQRPAGTSIADGGTDSLGGVAENVTATYTYYIVNGGNSTLDLTGTPVVDLQNATNATASVLTQPSITSLAPAGLAPFVVELTPGSGAFSFTLTIPNTDLNEGNYTFTVSGTGITTPEIDILDHDGFGVNEGGVVNLGNIPPGTPATYTITIQNNGNMDLMLTGTPAVQVSGQTNVTANVTVQPATTVTVGNSATFDIEVTPGAVGSFSFQLQILNNDANEGAFTFTVAGFASSTSGGGSGGGGDSGGGCSTAGVEIDKTWGLLLGALALLVIATRVRAARRNPS
ncbi:MAG: hypothetical protein H6839_10695 [Planctomycetes bacterium]|nr:hypothetical protein [Planctomycetota bacterium]